MFLTHFSSGLLLLLALFPWSLVTWIVCSNPETLEDVWLTWERLVDEFLFNSSFVFDFLFLTRGIRASSSLSVILTVWFLGYTLTSPGNNAAHSVVTMGRRPGHYHLWPNESHTDSAFNRVHFNSKIKTQQTYAIMNETNQFLLTASYLASIYSRIWQ